MAKCVKCGKEMDSFVLTERGRCNHCGFEVEDLVSVANQMLRACRFTVAMVGQSVAQTEEMQSYLDESVRLCDAAIARLKI